jgi:hypothetical protein
LTFIFDTGSAWTWIPSEDCPDEECPNRHYQYHLSSGYHDTGEVDNVVYGIGEIKGQIVNDDIAITKSTEYQAIDVNFLSVYYAKDLATIESDGLLGLSPKSNYVSRGNTEPMHLLVNEMKIDGII